MSTLLKAGTRTMEEIVIKNAALDYFAGRATPLQKKAIEDWLREPMNHEQYYQWLHEWEINHLQATSSWEKAFNRTQHHIEQDRKVVGTVRSVSVIGWWKHYTFRIVAAIVLFTLFGLFVYKTRDFIFYQTIGTTYGETRKITLSDGSQVTLNANSSLRYPRFGFGKGTRQVELAGEADFEIKHTPKHQRFIVSTATGMTITVLGTEFTVFARPRRSQVILRTGKVALQTHSITKALPIVMKPGDMVAINGVGKLSRTHTAKPERYSSWKNHLIVLERTSLQEIAVMLEETYGFQVELKGPDLANRTATGSLPVQNADVALELIADLFDINFVHHENKVIFKD